MILRKPLACVALLAGAVLAVAAFTVTADDTKDAGKKPALSGVWVLKGGEPKLEFADKGVLKIAPHGNDEVILLVCEYTVEKEGRVKVKLTDLEGKEEVKEKAKGILPIGLTFSFQWTVKKDTATLADVKGDQAEQLKAHLEGGYEKK